MAKYQHFRIERAPDTQPYRYIGGGGDDSFNAPPRKDRSAHGAKLRQDLHRVEIKATEQGTIPQRDGITLEFIGEPEFDLDFDKLNPKASQGIELMNVRRQANTLAATVYVPPGKLTFFINAVEQYANRRPKHTEGNKTRKPSRQRLLDSVAAIRLAAVRAFWTDNEDFPADHATDMWWEVWIRSGKTNAEHEAAFARFATAIIDTPFQPGMGFVRFPERLVLLVRGSVSHWAEHPDVLNLIAELRQAKKVPTDLVKLTPAEQRDWVIDAVLRISVSATTAPAVCVLDTGIWRDHPLLQSSLDAGDTHAVDIQWGVADHAGHGTEIAGLALFGQDLQDIVENNAHHRLTTRLESVKILPPRGNNDPANYGYVTQEGVARAERAQPHRPRAICMAVTTDDRDQGYPSLWSSAIDSHASGALDDHRRLYLVSTGNYRRVVDRAYQYPTTNHQIAGIEDPGQSWNAITVGACTERALIQDASFEGWSPVAPVGRLTPTSRTSMMWANKKWPLKPDLVMEGGNWARDGAGMVSPCTDLELLTTTYSDSGRLFDTMRDTSSATAQVARMAALLQSQYPNHWPETIRALLIHSARWTPQMQEEFPGDDQTALHNRLRCYGYGVPNLERARWSMQNQVCLIVERELQPFHLVKFNGGPSIQANEMHIHSLPWPKEALEQLGPEDVTVRITLSYFIEPSPERRGWSNNFCYPSHGLRYKLRGPLEKPETFRKRISRYYWEDINQRPEGTGEPQQWALGAAGLPNRGSVHSNWWKASAAAVAASGEIAVFPVTGWWKLRKHLDMFNRRARYALVVSIETSKMEVDLYTSIANQLEIRPQIII